MMLAYGGRKHLTDWQMEVNHAIKETGLSFNTDAVLTLPTKTSEVRRFELDNGTMSQARLAKEEHLLDNRLQALAAETGSTAIYWGQRRGVVKTCGRCGWRVSWITARAMPREQDLVGLARRFTAGFALKMAASWSEAAVMDALRKRGTADGPEAPRGRSTKRSRTHRLTTPAGRALPTRR
ncbi:hypothetical protein [Streptomyces sp. NPDC001851]|uniref:hypothetical protein n=1 Tax=Streptomyces sp. NPDC001851 TaxID=3154529 RepID=UPI003321AECA